MSNPDQGPAPRSSGPSEADSLSRPQIWVEGRQQPRFDFRAWAGVSLTMTRRKLGPAMSAAAARIDGFGQSVLRGEHVPNLAWAGRAQRLIPSHESVGGLVTGAAQLLAEAREVVLPAPKPAEPIAYPNLIRPNFAGRPARWPLPQPVAMAGEPETIAPPPPLQAQGEESTLRAIRSVIVEPGATTAPAVAPRLPKEASLPELARPEPAARTVAQKARDRSSALLRRTAALVLAWGLTALVFPLGGVKAALFHLDGGDLRDWS
jgi:hypothetical protein